MDKSNLYVNIAALVLHTGALIGVGVMYNTVTEKEASAVPGINTSLYRLARTRSSVEVKQVTEHNPHLVIGLIIAFVLVTMVAHTLHILRQKLKGENFKGNHWRWVEYAISATIMAVIIALSSGESSLDNLVVLSLLTVCTMLCGWVTELCMTNGYDWKIAVLAFVIGWLTYAGVWYLLGSTFKSATDAAKPPDFVYAIIGTMAAFFSSFGVVQLVQLVQFYRSDDNSRTNFDYMPYELSYNSLSIVSKFVLTMLVATGLYQRATFTPPPSVSS